jgi:putative ABC transport system substrate-binding protein
MRAGIAVSTARPGKNFTGITFLTDEMAGKPIELLKEVAPRRKARWRDIQSPAFR